MLFDAFAALADILKTQTPPCDNRDNRDKPPEIGPLSQLSQVSQVFTPETGKAPTPPNQRAPASPHPFSPPDWVVSALSGGGEPVAGREHPCTICKAPNAPHGYGWPGQRRLLPPKKRGRIWACDDCQPITEGWWNVFSKPMGPIDE